MKTLKWPMRLIAPNAAQPALRKTCQADLSDLKRSVTSELEIAPKLRIIADILKPTFA